ncbi:pyrimidine-nucleoside phosphorylase, partial [bacterium]|nr:pyrimidine-nucleoside phosphorylase [bacterium]
IYLYKHVGDKVKNGDTLAEVHVDPTRNNIKALEQLLDTFHFEKNPIEPKPIIFEIVT